MISGCELGATAVSQETLPLSPLTGPHALASGLATAWGEVLNLDCDWWMARMEGSLGQGGWLWFETRGDVWVERPVWMVDRAG